MRSRLASFCAALALTAATLLPAQAQDDQEALYGAAPPADAIFVRFLPALEEDGTRTAFGRDFALEADTATGYTILSAGDLEPGTVEAGTRYTVLNAGEDAPVIIAEPAHDPAKVLVALYNLSDRPVALKTGDGAVEIVASVAPDAAGFREVNPLRVPLALFAGDDMLEPGVMETTLRRGENPAFVVLPDGSVAQVLAEDLPYQPED